MYNLGAVLCGMCRYDEMHQLVNVIKKREVRLDDRSFYILKRAGARAAFATRVCYEDGMCFARACVCLC